MNVYYPIKKFVTCFENKMDHQKMYDSVTRYERFGGKLTRKIDMNSSTEQVCAEFQVMQNKTRRYRMRRFLKERAKALGVRWVHQVI